jgi:hypothetical protein
MKEAKRKKLEAAGWRVGSAEEFLTSKKPRRTKFRRRQRRGVRPRRHWRGTELVVTYKGGVDGEKDRAVRKALGKYENGSGFSFMTGERDHTATVPDDAFARVVRELKKIRGITTKKLVKKWVRCR